VKYTDGNHYLLGYKCSKYHKLKPKRANGLHFVWGAVFLFGGGLKPLKFMPGYVPGPISLYKPMLIGIDLDVNKIFLT